MSLAFHWFLPTYPTASRYTGLSFVYQFSGVYALCSLEGSATLAN
jgi:hypothetical protein